MENLEIRYTQANDFNTLIKWLENEDINRWFPMSKRKEIELSAKNWIGYYKYNASLTAVLDGKVVSIGTLFLMPYKKLFHLAQFSLIVDPIYQKKGIGNDMLKNLINLAKNHFKMESIYAEVFEGCKIVSLLDKFGFNKFATQEKFVKDKDKYLDRMLFDLWF